MSHRKLLHVLSIFHASVNTLYLVRFFGVLPPEAVVYVVCITQHCFYIVIMASGVFTV